MNPIFNYQLLTDKGYFSFLFISRWKIYGNFNPCVPSSSLGGRHFSSKRRPENPTLGVFFFWVSNFGEILPTLVPFRTSHTHLSLLYSSGGEAKLPLDGARRSTRRYDTRQTFPRRGPKIHLFQPQRPSQSDGKFNVCKCESTTLKGLQSSWALFDLKKKSDFLSKIFPSCYQFLGGFCWQSERERLNKIKIPHFGRMYVGMGVRARAARQARALTDAQTRVFKQSSIRVGHTS